MGTCQKALPFKHKPCNEVSPTHKCFPGLWIPWLDLILSILEILFSRLSHPDLYLWRPTCCFVSLQVPKPCQESLQIKHEHPAHQTRVRLQQCEVYYNAKIGVTREWMDKQGLTLTQFLHWSIQLWASLYRSLCGRKNMCRSGNKYNKCSIDKRESVM